MITHDKHTVLRGWYFQNTQDISRLPLTMLRRDLADRKRPVYLQKWITLQQLLVAMGTNANIMIFRVSYFESPGSVKISLILNLRVTRKVWETITIA